MKVNTCHHIVRLIYYVRPHPFDAVLWDPVAHIGNQWDLDNNLSRHRGEAFLAVTEHGLDQQMQREFEAVSELGTIDIKTGPGGGKSYVLSIVRGYRRN